MHCSNDAKSTPNVTHYRTGNPLLFFPGVAVIRVKACDATVHSEAGITISIPPLQHTGTTTASPSAVGIDQHTQYARDL